MQDEAAAQQLGKKWEPSREDDPIQVDIAVCLPAEDTAPYVSAWLSEHGVKHSAVSFPNSTSIISASVRPSLLGRLSLLDGVRDVAPLGSLTPRGRGAPPHPCLIIDWDGVSGSPPCASESGSPLPPGLYNMCTCTRVGDIQ